MALLSGINTTASEDEIITRTVKQLPNGSDAGCTTRRVRQFTTAQPIAH